MQNDLNALIRAHSGLVYSQLHKFYLINDPEAESIAFEALLNALRNFDESKNTKLSTVATVYIYNALGSYVRKLNKQRVIETISYNNIAYADDSEEHEFVDMLSTGEDIESNYVRSELYAHTRRAFNELYDTLTNDKHKAILALWNESDFTATTVEISKQVGVSQSYVSQVINGFKAKLKKKLEDVYYD